MQNFKTLLIHLWGEMYNAYPTLERTPLFICKGGETLNLTLGYSCEILYTNGLLFSWLFISTLHTLLNFGILIRFNHFKVLFL